MSTRNTREENKENRENSGKIRKQIHLHRLLEEQIHHLVFLSILWYFCVCEPLFFRPKHDIFIARVI